VIPGPASEADKFGNRQAATTPAERASAFNLIDELLLLHHAYDFARIVDEADR
jgi:hypothetical protein